MSIKENTLMFEQDLIDEFIRTQEALIEKRKRFIADLPFAYRSGNVDLAAQPLYSQVFGGSIYRTDPRNFKSKEALLNALDKMADELSYRNYSQFIIRNRIESFRRYVFSAMGGYAPHIMSRFYRLSDKAKILLLLNTDIYSVVGSPTSETMRETYDEINGYMDWAEETAKDVKIGFNEPEMI